SAQCAKLRVLLLRALPPAPPRGLIPSAGRIRGISLRPEFEEFPQQPRRNHRDGIDPKDRGCRRAGNFVGKAKEPFVAAAEYQAENWNVAKHIVEAVERNERAAQMDVALHVIDETFRRDA